MPHRGVLGLKEVTGVVITVGGVTVGISGLAGDLRAIIVVEFTAEPRVGERVPMDAG